MLEIVNVVIVCGCRCFSRETIATCEKVKKQKPFNSFINFIIEMIAVYHVEVRSQIRLFIHIYGGPTL